MQAQDVMTTVVATIDADATVKDAAKLMLERGVSALPVMDARDQVVGMISEGDLVRRAELGTDAPRSWWLAALSEESGRDYTRTHSTAVRDVMTKPVLAVRRTTPLQEVARLMEKHRIKRLPVVHAGQLVGIVSRADLVRRLATAPTASAPRAATDRVLRKQVLKQIAESGVNAGYINVIVERSTVHLWGAVRTAAEQKALRTAARGVPGVRKVEDHTFVMAPRLVGALGAQ